MKKRISIFALAILLATLSGYTYSATLEDIEGLRTIEEIETERKAAELAEKERKEAEQKAAEEAIAAKRKANDAKAKSFAKGYTYHGIDEDTSNARLFKNEALEAGHAYYISGFVVSKYSNNMGAVVISLFEESNYLLVDYVNTKVKNEVLNASKTVFGNLPVTVVVAGGSGRSKTPVILGLVE